MQTHEAPARQDAVREMNHGTYNSRTQTRDEERFLTRILRRRIQRRNAVKGARGSPKLRVALSAAKFFLWVYNLHTECTAAEAESHVKELIEDDDVTVKKLTLKRTESSAFIVTCKRRHQDALLQSDSWEKMLDFEPTGHRVFHQQQVSAQVAVSYNVLVTLSLLIFKSSITSWISYNIFA